MQTMDKTSFKFSELSDEAKQYAIDKHYENEDFPFLGEDLKEEFKNLDEKQYWSNIELFYSLSCCQGDGLCFSGDFDFKKYLKDNKRKFKLKKKDLEFFQENIYKVCSGGNGGGRYPFPSENDVKYEENVCIEDIFNDEEDDFKREMKKILVTDLMNKWQDIFYSIQQYYLEICSKLEKYGYDILEYRMDKKDFEDFSESNDYEYDEEGNLL